MSSTSVWSNLPVRQGSEESHTETDLLAGVWRLKEGSQSENGRECTRNDNVEAVIKRQSPDVDCEGHVDILFRTTIVLHHVALRHHS